MNAKFDDVLDAALALPAGDRARLVDSLIESLDSQVEAQVEAAWAAEIARRSREIDLGTAKTLSWDAVRNGDRVY